MAIGKAVQMEANSANSTASRRGCSWASRLDCHSESETELSWASPSGQETATSSDLVLDCQLVFLTERHLESATALQTDEHSARTKGWRSAMLTGCSRG